jgi:hypothetical protein
VCLCRDCSGNYVRLLPLGARRLGRRPGELVIPKEASSAFHGTPLLQYLIGLGVDTVLTHQFSPSASCYGINRVNCILVVYSMQHSTHTAATGLKRVARPRCW